MYLDEIDSKTWVKSDAISKYEIKYRDVNIAIAKLKQHLLCNIKNPNLKKTCREDSQKMLQSLCAVDVIHIHKLMSSMI